ncbi:DUF6158 family protein [Micromonospora sp. WMMD882]|uniref:DUF6158 family protein n=1 Tax=Micromonospora sp. WMMD882 TaxID=3015151 RepID=UPI00248CE02F|nr:DUF6158 family protein [Micromonospora sp. WMMD882]WBB79537.1 DUF6158 family protein [Micromonospora sp. WMMD882]
MTGPVRQDGFPPRDAAVDASPEQRLPEWDGDHLHDMAATGPDPEGDLPGVDPAELADEDLIRELRSLHRTRLDTLRHAADSALANHLRRTAELETEYLARHPGREVDPSRLRDA